MNAVFDFENIFLVLQYIQLPYEHTSNYAVIAYLLYFNVIIINEQFLLEKHKVDTEINKINDTFMEGDNFSKLWQEGSMYLYVMWFHDTRSKYDHSTIYLLI